MTATAVRPPVAPAVRHVTRLPAILLRLCPSLALLWLALTCGLIPSLRAIGHPLLFDFGIFLATGRALARGLAPYGNPPLVAPELAARLDGSPNMNPPALLPVFRLLADADPDATFGLWYVISLACYLLALLVLARVYPSARSGLWLAWSLALAGLWYGLSQGQVYAALTLLAVLTWVSLRADRPILAGILLGILVAAKPNLALWPIFLFLADHHRPALVSVLTAGLLSLVPVLLYGPGIYLSWLHVAANYPGAPLPTNASLVGFFARLGLPALGYPVVAGLALWLALRVHCERPGVESASASGLTLSLLCSPIAWVGYTTMLLPAFVSIRLRWPALLAAGLLTLPAGSAWEWGMSTASYAPLTGSLYSLALLALTYAHSQYSLIR